MEHRLLLIETSATQRYVASNFLEESGFDVRHAENFSLAHTKLEEQFSEPEQTVDCVILSWPIAPDDEMQSVLEALEGPDFHDLPVIVLSQNMPAQARAWVAGRQTTVLASWREYKSIAGLLERLLGEPGVDVAEHAQLPKFSNADISVLVVDDSPSIRYALSDLLGLHGYQVTVVADSNEALAALDRQRFDIAIIDYYLRDETGDALVRQLLAHPAGSELTCAVLTGNYADHIIQQSLRAGAVECMFKNESSELLLARVDAISRLVRGRSQQHSDRSRLYAAMDAVDHAVLGVDGRGEVSFANPAACAVMGVSAASLRGLSAVGQIMGELSEPQLLAFQQALESGGDLSVERAEFSPLQGQPIAVDYHGVGLGAGEGLLLCFSPLNRPVDVPTLSPVAESRFEPMVPGVSFSCLLMSVEFSLKGGAWRSVSLSEKMVKLIAIRISQRALQADRFQYLGQGLFLVLLGHRTPETAYAAARLLANMVSSLGAGLSNIDIACHSSLTPVSSSGKPQVSEIALAKKGAALAKKHGFNKVYLADRKQLITASTSR